MSSRTTDPPDPATGRAAPLDVDSDSYAPVPTYPRSSVQGRGVMSGGGNDSDGFVSPLVGRNEGVAGYDFELTQGDVEMGNLVSDRKFESMELLDFSEDFGHLHRANNFAYFKQSSGPSPIAIYTPSELLNDHLPLKLPLEEIYGSLPRQRLVSTGLLDDIFTNIGNDTLDDSGEAGSLQRDSTSARLTSFIDTCASASSDNSLASAAEVAKMLGEELEDTFGRGLLHEDPNEGSNLQIGWQSSKNQTIMDEDATEQKTGMSRANPAPSSSGRAPSPRTVSNSGIRPSASPTGGMFAFSSPQKKAEFVQRAHRGLPAPTWVAGRLDPASDGVSVPKPPPGFSLSDGSELSPYEESVKDTHLLKDDKSLETEISKKRASANRVLSLAHVRFLESHWPTITRLVICALIAVITSCIGWLVEYLSASFYDIMLQVIKFFIRQHKGAIPIWVFFASLSSAAIIFVYSVIAVTATYLGGFYPLRGSGLAHIVSYLDGSYDPRLPLFTPIVLICKPISVVFAMACGVKGGLQAPLIHTGGVVGKQFSRMLTKVLASDVFAQMLMFFCCCCVDTEQRCRPPWSRRGLIACCDWIRSGACFRGKKQDAMRAAQESSMRSDYEGYAGLYDDELAEVDIKGEADENTYMFTASQGYLSPSLSQAPLSATSKDGLLTTPLGNSRGLDLPKVPSAFGGSSSVSDANARLLGQQQLKLNKSREPVKESDMMLFEYQRYQRIRSRLLVGDSTHPLDVALGLRTYAAQELDLDLRLDDDIEQMLQLADSTSQEVDHATKFGRIPSLREGPSATQSDTPGSIPEVRNAGWAMSGLKDRKRAETVLNPYLEGSQTASFAENESLAPSTGTHLHSIAQGNEDELDEDFEANEEADMLGSSDSLNSSKSETRSRRLSGSPSDREKSAFLTQRTARGARATATGDKSVSSIVFERTSLLSRNRHMNTVSAGFLTHSATPQKPTPPPPPPVPLLLNIPNSLSLLSSAIRGPNDEHDFIACGAVAGFTSAFNCPLAAVVMVQGFARASTSIQLTLRLFWSALFAVLTSNLLDSSSSVMPDRGFIDLDISQAAKLNAREIGVCILIAVFGGLLGVLLTKINLLIQGWRRRFGHRLKENFIYTFVVALLSIVPGLIIACSMSCKKFSDEVFPVCISHPDRCLRMSCPPGQFSQVGTLFFSFPDRLVRVLWNRDPLNVEYDISVLIIFLFGYAMLSCMFYMAALPGGFFVPSIVIGAIYGRLVGRCVSALGGEVNHGVYAVLGSTSMLASINRHTLPIAVMMVEFTSDAQFLIPIMVVVLISKYVADSMIGSMESEEMKMNGSNLSLGQTPHPVLTRVTARDLMATRFSEPSINWSKLEATTNITPGSSSQTLSNASDSNSSRYKQLQMYKRVILSDLQNSLTRLATNVTTMLSFSPLPRCPATAPPPLAGWASPLAFNDVCCVGEIDTLARIRSILTHTTHQSFPVVTVLPQISREFFKSHAFCSSLSTNTRHPLPGVGVYLGVIERTQLEALLERAADFRRVEHSAIVLRRKEIIKEQAAAKKQSAFAAWNALIATQTAGSANMSQEEIKAQYARKLMLASASPALPPSHRLFSTPFVYFSFAIQALSRDQTTRSRMLLMSALIYRVQLAKYFRMKEVEGENVSQEPITIATAQQLLSQTVDYTALSIFLPPLPRTVASSLVGVRRSQWMRKHAEDVKNSGELGVSLARAKPSSSLSSAPSSVAQSNSDAFSSETFSIENENELSNSFKQRLKANLRKIADFLEARADRINEPKIKKLQPLKPIAEVTPRETTRLRASSQPTNATIHPDDVTKWVNLMPFIDRGAYTVASDTSGHRLWRQFRLIGMRRLVVLDALHRPIGFITRKDMVVAEQSLAARVREEAQEYESYTENNY